jgi:hypothetical protein
MILALGLAVGAAAASADGITKRVRFAKGKTSARLSGAVVRGDRDTYILGAKAEQMMTVKITSTEDNQGFSDCRARRRVPYNRRRTRAGTQPID